MGAALRDQIGVRKRSASKLSNGKDKNLARPERFELPTYWFEASCSIRLSYGRTAIIKW